MEKIQEIPFEIALEKSPPIYLPSVEYIYNSLLPDEKVIFIGKCTVHYTEVKKKWSDFQNQWKEKKTFYNTPSLLVITNERWIRKWTNYYPKDPQMVLFFNKNAKKRIWDSMENSYCWIEPNNEVPYEGHYERAGKTLQEWGASNIRFVSLMDIKVLDKRFCYTTIENLQTVFVQLNIDNYFYTFNADDGEILFLMLQAASKNSGKITIEQKGIGNKQNTTEGIAERLKLVQDLFEENLITEAEYQEKKKQILLDV